MFKLFKVMKTRQRIPANKKSTLLTHLLKEKVYSVQCWINVNPKIKYQQRESPLQSNNCHFHAVLSSRGGDWNTNYAFMKTMRVTTFPPILTLEHMSLITMSHISYTYDRFNVWMLLSYYTVLKPQHHHHHQDFIWVCVNEKAKGKSCQAFSSSRVQSRFQGFLQWQLGI